MKAVRLFCILFCLTILCSGLSFATDLATTSSSSNITATRVTGPAPVPLCPPEDGWCDTMPGPRPTVTTGPAPVPLCPPEDGWCDTMPGPRPTVTRSK